MPCLFCWGPGPRGPPLPASSPMGRGRERLASAPLLPPRPWARGEEEGGGGSLMVVTGEGLAGFGPERVPRPHVYVRVRGFSLLACVLVLCCTWCFLSFDFEFWILGLVGLTGVVSLLCFGLCACGMQGRQPIVLLCAVGCLPCGAFSLCDWLGLCNRAGGPPLVAGHLLGYAV